MAKAKQDLEITLAAIEIPSLKRRSSSEHIVKATLLWPRVSIAAKTRETTLPFAKGILDIPSLNWCQKMLFKETVEGHFGLSLEISVPMTQVALRNFARFMLGQSLKLGANLADDAFPGGDYAVLPARYASNSLLEKAEPKLLVRGFWDLDVSSLSEEETIVRVPLQTISTKATGTGNRSTKCDFTPASNTKIIKKNSSDGFAELKIVKL